MGASLPPQLAALPEHLRTLAATGFPKFSDAEYARRERLLDGVMARAGVDHLLIVTAAKVGNCTEWITAWPGTTEAITVFRPGERMAMWAEYYNHLPLAARMVRQCDVHWSADAGIAQAIAELKRRGARKVGTIGPISVPRFRQLEAEFPGVALLDGDYTRLRIFEKSDEEIDWLRIGAAYSDAAFASLLANTRPGLSESELADLVERAYVPFGGQHGIHYIATTAMNAPAVHVPLQFPSARRVAAGDVITCELSAAFWGYSGQVLRSFTVDAEPTQLYSDLHGTAQAVFAAVTGAIRPGATPPDLIEAAALVEANGFTTCDDLVHGYGGGYFQPILGSKSRPAPSIPQMTLRENMCVVVQPNVITTDKRAGVQVGELVRVTQNGCETLHRTPHGFFRAGTVLA